MIRTYLPLFLLLFGGSLGLACSQPEPAERSSEEVEVRTAGSSEGAAKGSLPAGPPLGCVIPAARRCLAPSSTLKSPFTGEPAEVPLAAGEKHVYPLDLPSLDSLDSDEGEYLEIVVEQQGVDLEACLWAGETLLAFADTLISLDTPERLAVSIPPGGVSAAGEGGYRLEIHALDNSPAGSYRARIAARREMTEGDAARLEKAAFADQLCPIFCDFPGMEVEAVKQRCLEASETWRSLGNPDRAAQALFDLGNVWFREGRHREARSRFEEALELWEGSGNSQGQVSALTRVAEIHFKEGRLELAVADHERASELCAPDYRCRVNSLLNLGRVNRHLGRLDAAESLCAEALGIAREAGNRELECRALSHLGTVVWYRENFEAATRFHLQALDVCERAADRGGNGLQEEITKLLTNLGADYYSLGEFREAREYLIRAEAALRRAGASETGTPEARVRFSLNFGNVESALGRRSEALRHYEEALKVLGEAHVAPTTRAMALNRRGALLQLQGSGDSARTDFREALRTLGQREGTEELKERSFSWRGIGLWHAEQGEHEVAFDALRQALELSRGADDFIEAITLADLGDVYRDRARGDDLRTAEERYDEAVERAVGFGDDLLEAVIRGRRMRLYRQLGELDRAEEEGERTIALFEKVQDAAGEAVMRATFLAERRSYYELFISVLMERAGVGATGSPTAAPAQRRRYLEKALRVSELGRARALLDLLAQSQVEVDDKAGPPRVGVFEDLAEVQTLLGEGQALLEYVLGEEGAYLFVITRDDLSALSVGDVESLRRAVGRVREGLFQPTQVPEAYRSAYSTLYRRLIAPAEDLLDGARHLIIVPDDVLFQIPFEALVRAPASAATGGRPSYLAERWATSYVSSASVLVSLGARGRPGSADWEWIGFGNPAYDPEDGPPPLPHSRQEVKAIAATFEPAGVKLYLGAEASEDRVTANPEIARARRLHFATHGRLDGESPALLLAPAVGGDGGDGGDGVLELGSLYDLDLSAADLVVLSACDSGLGKEVRGEGFIGMTHAFMHAGARSLVLSLWRVDDRSSAELMVSFYEHLKTKDKAEALRRARLDLLTRPQLGDPRYWAPFVLVGDYRATSSP